MALVLLMVASLMGGISATPEKTPYLVGQCTSAPTAINMLSYTVSDNQTACPNLNVSVHWNITVNVTSPSTGGSFNASVSAGLCSLGLSVYTKDFLAISGTTGRITIVYIPPTAGLVTTVQIAYAANGIYLRSSDQLTLYSNGPLPSYPLWDIYGVTSTTLCQLMGSQLIDPLINLKPFDNDNPTCDATTLLRPQSTGIRLTSLSLPLVPGNYTLLLTNGMCTSPNLLTSPPLYLTVLPSNSMPSTVVVQPTTIPSPAEVNKGAIVGGIFGGLGGLVAILVAVLIIVVVIIAMMRKTGGFKFHREEVPLPVVSTIAVLGVERSPWLGSFSATLASCDRATLLPLEETCTVQVLHERLAKCSRVYLVLNGPSDELVTTLRDSELPEDALSKLVVVELRDTVLTDRSHPNVKWIPPLPEVQPSAHEEYAKLVHGYYSRVPPPPSHMGAAQQDPPPTVITSTLVLTPGESSRGSPMAEPAELTQLHDVLNKIVDDLKDVKHGVNSIVDRHQEESMADILVP